MSMYTMLMFVVLSYLQLSPDDQETQMIQSPLGQNGEKYLSRRPVWVQRPWSSSSKPSRCATNCLRLAEQCLFFTAFLQRRGAVSCITVTGHWAARLMHGSCTHFSSTTFHCAFFHVQPTFMQINYLFKISSKFKPTFPWTSEVKRSSF